MQRPAPVGPRAWFVLTVAFIVVATACGTGTTAGSGAPSRSNSVFDAALGTPNPATGEPVPVGMITDAGMETGETGQQVDAGARMAEAWANDYRAGVAGRPIDLVICETRGTAAGAAECANQMVERGVVAVTMPFSGNGPVEVPVFAKAGIPYIVIAGISQEEMMTPGAFSLSGGFPLILGGTALHAKSEGFEKIGILLTEFPGGNAAANSLGGIVFDNAGVDFTIVSAPIGESDLSSQIEQLVGARADALAIVGDTKMCGDALESYRELGLALPKYLVFSCLDAHVVEAHSDTIEDSYMVSVNAASGQEAALYAAMTRRYAPDIDPYPEVSGNQMQGAAAVIALVNIMDGYGGEVTAASVLDQVRSRKDVPLPFSGGITFTCDGAAIPLIPNICSARGKAGTLTSIGKVTDPIDVDVSPLFETR